MSYDAWLTRNREAEDWELACEAFDDEMWRSKIDTSTWTGAEYARAVEAWIAERDAELDEGDPDRANDEAWDREMEHRYGF